MSDLKDMDSTKTHMYLPLMLFLYLKTVDKSNTYTLAVAGYKFVVLPEPFVIHLNHPEAAWDGPSIQEQLVCLFYIYNFSLFYY